jgi:hypothetical protein
MYTKPLTQTVCSAANVRSVSRGHRTWHAMSMAEFNCWALLRPIIWCTKLFSSLNPQSSHSNFKDMSEMVPKVEAAAHYGKMESLYKYSAPVGRKKIITTLQQHHQDRPHQFNQSLFSKLSRINSCTTFKHQHHHYLKSYNLQNAYLNYLRCRRLHGSHLDHSRCSIGDQVRVHHPQTQYGRNVRQ